jgi:hypothetical protein
MILDDHHRGGAQLRVEGAPHAESPSHVRDDPHLGPCPSSHVRAVTCSGVHVQRSRGGVEARALHLTAVQAAESRVADECSARQELYSRHKSLEADHRWRAVGMGRCCRKGGCCVIRKRQAGAWATHAGCSASPDVHNRCAQAAGRAPGVAGGGTLGGGGTAAQPEQPGGFRSACTVQCVPTAVREHVLAWSWLSARPPARARLPRLCSPPCHHLALLGGHSRGHTERRARAAALSRARIIL